MATNIYAKFPDEKRIINENISNSLGILVVFRVILRECKKNLYVELQ